jgi:hypothetical protein
MDTNEKAFRVNYGDRTSKPPIFAEVKVAVLGCSGNVILFVRDKFLLRVAGKHIKTDNSGSKITMRITQNSFGIYQIIYEKSRIGYKFNNNNNNNNIHTCILVNRHLRFWKYTCDQDRGQKNFKI